MIIGIGIGVLLSGILMSFNSNDEVTDQTIEKRAYELGMIYETECKVIFE